MPVRVKQVKSKDLPPEVVTIIQQMNCQVNGDNFFWWLVIDTNTKNWLAFTGARNIEEDIIYFGPTYVKPEARGQSLQLKMIKVKLRWTKQKKYKYIISCIDKNNIYSGNNLINSGFYMIENKFTKDKDEIWFKKDLC